MGRSTAGGSISVVGSRFQSFKINDLEMVAQIFPRWNRLEDWLREAEGYSTGRVRLALMMITCRNFLTCHDLWLCPVAGHGAADAERYKNLYNQVV